MVNFNGDRVASARGIAIDELDKINERRAV